MVVKFANKEDHPRMLAFQKAFYRGYPHYRDGASRTLKALLNNELEIQKSSELLPILVEQEGSIRGIAVLAVIDRLGEYLQLSFLEYEEDSKILSLMVDFAKREANQRGINKLLLGLNLHVNYGLGFLASDFDKNQSLGSSYNPPYYVEDMKNLASRVQELVSYKSEINDIDMNLPPRVMDRIASKFEIRHADFKNIKETARIYNTINNQAFTKHNYYYERRESEDLELFEEYRLFLKPENLLFAYHQGEPVGFILWYPDLNQLIAANQELGLLALIKSQLFPRSVDAIKITEIGVIPKYQRLGVIYALLNRCYELTKDRYRYVESGWILAENFLSKSLGERFIQKESKRYQVFEIDC